MSDPFGILPAGQPLQTTPTSRPSETSFLYAVPRGTTPFSHLAVFLLPGITLPPNTAAAIYLALNPAALVSGSEPPNFRFLGGVGEGKESAVFKLNAGSVPSAPAPAPAPPGSGQVQGQGQDLVVIGINIEEASSVAERVQQQKSQNPTKATTIDGSCSCSSSTIGANSNNHQQQRPTTQVLAQRIIQNAYNFLSSFSGQAGEVEVVPLKAFQEWWKKFEGRVRSDPTFLERPQE